MHALTDRQERFIHEYLIDHNASAAAVRAGYSPKTKGTQAAELMKDARVQARIAIEMGELFGRLKVSAFELLRRQVCALNFDPAKLFDASGVGIPLAKLDEETKAGLSVTFEERGGERVLRARQTPRHVALAALWRRFDAFQKVQERALATLVGEEREAAQKAEMEARIEGGRVWAEAQIQVHAQARGEAMAREQARLREEEEVQRAKAAEVPRVPPDLTNVFPWQREINAMRARREEERERALQAATGKAAREREEKAEEERARGKAEAEQREAREKAEAESRRAQEAQVEFRRVMWGEGPAREGDEERRREVTQLLGRELERSKEQRGGV